MHYWGASDLAMVAGELAMGNEVLGLALLDSSLASMDLGP